jgi:hypothetical protein
MLLIRFNDFENYARECSTVVITIASLEFWQFGNSRSGKREYRRNYCKLNLQTVETGAEAREKTS